MDDRELSARLTSIEEALKEIRDTLYEEIQEQEERTDEEIMEDNNEIEKIPIPEPPKKIKPKKKATEWTNKKKKTK